MNRIGGGRRRLLWNLPLSHILSPHRLFSSSPSPPRRRVVVTGYGIVCSLGTSVPSVWHRLINGESGVRSLTPSLFPSIHQLDLPTKIAAFVDPTVLTSSSPLPTSSPFIQYALIAANEAMASSGLLPHLNSLSREQRSRIGVCVGCGMSSLEDSYEAGRALSEKGRKGVSPYTVPRILTNLAAGNISIAYKLHGPNHCVSTACTTGTHSIGDAYRFIQYGDADVMVAGSTEASVTPISMALFSRIRALSTKYNDTPHTASRPFDKHRDGFVMSEGAAILILEELSHALQRVGEAKIQGEVVGYGLSADAFHVTNPSSDGFGAALSMRNALSNGGLAPKDIHYVNAHATSTPIGDKVESLALNEVFGKWPAQKLNISSTKGSIGHMLGAAGTAEAIFSLKALEEGIVPPTLNLKEIDKNEGFLLDFTPLEAVKRSDMRYALSNSFGFGGTNATLVFKKWEGK